MRIHERRGEEGARKVSFLIKNEAFAFSRVIMREFRSISPSWNYLRSQPTFGDVSSRLKDRVFTQRACTRFAYKLVSKRVNYARERDVRRGIRDNEKRRNEKTEKRYGAWKVVYRRRRVSEERKVEGDGWKNEEKRKKKRVRGSRCKGETSSVVDSLRFIFASESVPCPLPYSVFQNRLTLSRSWLG